MSGKVERFVLEDVRLPTKPRRPSNSTPKEQPSDKSNPKKRKAGDLYDDMDLTNKEEVRSFMRTIKEFNANSELGSSRRNHQEDLLTQLGAPPPKQQKMPFKLRLKLDDARKKREERKLDELRQSGEVTAVHKTLLQKAQQRREKRKARK
jgi:hypothetical protein|eukprot:gene12510-8945_t